jgi:hypothetical protein
MAANRAAMEAKDKKYEDTKNALDLKKLNTQKKGTESLESANKKQAEEQQKKLDLNASETDLLKQYAEQQGSAYIKDKPTGMTVAEANKAGMVQEAQSAKEGAIKKAEEAQKKEEEAKKANTTTAGTGTATQESPATLLASLNNKMDQLINVNRRVFEVAENQLSVQKGLTGNLYKSI